MLLRLACFGRKAVGFPLSAASNIIVHPITGVPVVWYNITISETHHWVDKQKNASGDIEEKEQKRVSTIFENKVGCEFLLADGDSFTEVDIRGDGQARIKTIHNQRGTGLPSGNVGPDVRAFLMTFQRKDLPQEQEHSEVSVSIGGVSIGFGHQGHKAPLLDKKKNRYEYSWRCSWVPVGVKIAVVGMIGEGSCTQLERENFLDLREGAQGLRLTPCYPGSVGEQEQKEMGWTPKQVKIFGEEAGKGGAIFVSTTDEAMLSCAVAPSKIQQPQIAYGVEYKQSQM